jgi:hypothetical protein
MKNVTKYKNLIYTYINYIHFSFLEYDVNLLDDI